jgi:2-amino-4-hydroxy-6-hydroxymethyldihydropteridine diphosphokinase
MTRCLIAAGSNQGDSAGLIDEAMDRMGRLPSTSIVACSASRQTAAVGPASRPFVNACLLVDTGLKPESLLADLLSIEKALGRRRDRNARPALVDRPLDLDIILFGDFVLASAGPVIPHPRMSFRRFVLEPAVEIAPGMRHPLFRGTVRHMLDCINDDARQIVVIGEDLSILPIPESGRYQPDATKDLPSSLQWTLVPLEYPAEKQTETGELPERMNLLVEFSDAPASSSGLSFPEWTGPRWHVGAARSKTAPDEFSRLIRTAIDSMERDAARRESE